MGRGRRSLSVGWRGLAGRSTTAAGAGLVARVADAGAGLAGRAAAGAGLAGRGGSAAGGAVGKPFGGAAFGAAPGAAGAAGSVSTPAPGPRRCKPILRL